MDGRTDGCVVCAEHLCALSLRLLSSPVNSHRRTGAEVVEVITACITAFLALIALTVAACIQVQCSLPAGGTDGNRGNRAAPSTQLSHFCLLLFVSEKFCCDETQEQTKPSVSDTAPRRAACAAQRLPNTPRVTALLGFPNVGFFFKKSKVKLRSENSCDCFISNV